jgi:hypothetical protein
LSPGVLPVIYTKGGFADVIKVIAIDLKMKRLSWISWMGQM